MLRTLLLPLFIAGFAFACARPGNFEVRPARGKAHPSHLRGSHWLPGDVRIHPATSELERRIVLALDAARGSVDDDSNVRWVVDVEITRSSGRAINGWFAAGLVAGGLTSFGLCFAGTNALAVALDDPRRGPICHEVVALLALFPALMAGFVPPTLTLSETYEGTASVRDPQGGLVARRGFRVHWEQQVSEYVEGRERAARSEEVQRQLPGAVLEAAVLALDEAAQLPMRPNPPKLSLRK